MANLKISALPAVTLPVVRTAPTVVVQGGTTKRITINELTGEYEATGTIASADILTCGTIPIELVPTPGAGFYLRVIREDVFLEYGSIPYATSTQSCLKHPTAVKPVFATGRILANTVDSSEMGVLQDTINPTDTLIIENEGLDFTTSNGVDPTAGDSDLKYRIRFAKEPAL